MFGLIFGTICLVLLFMTFRRRRWYAAYGYAGDEGYGGYGPGGCDVAARWFDPPQRERSGYRGGYGPPWRAGFRGHVARQLMARMDTTPGQEKVIRQAFDTLRESMRAAREDLKSARQDLARAIGGDELDQQALTDAIAKQDAFVNRARLEVVRALKTVHDSLDPKQRKTLAEWIADGSLRGLHDYHW